ncbi:trypsin-like serine protease [Allokutzneria sp. NRRL B-24872]|uniref:S1 family peptidase n=1 Tax=Allokutzneria sp. NRRL B-24872 TaxID=1137961 RepID=UPI000A367313|nr:serine protease [Allokutzneria sp. NRRL B-24872]
MKMRSLLIAVTAVAATLLGQGTAAATPAGDVGSRIVGGGDATETYSFMASMQAKATGAHRCGASLIAPQWLVTAAHCVAQQNPADYQFRIGSTSRTGGGELVGADKFVQHPWYIPVFLGWNDIAVVHLSAPVSAEPIKIADASPAAQTAARIIGWGLTCPERGCGQPPVTLQELNTKIESDSSCSAIPFDAQHELCVDAPNNTASACFGDSGGPALLKADGVWRLAGATSRGQSLRCTSGDTIYSDVTSHRDWINQQLGSIR